MKIIVSAYACQPSSSSEPGVGWNVSRAIAAIGEAWVLTRSNNRGLIEKELKDHPAQNLRFVYHDLPKWARWWKKGNRGIHLYYYLWQITAIAKVRALHKEERFDIGHHVTLVTFRHPSVLAWTGIQFVWGPVAGGERAPVSFYSGFGLKGAVSELLRDFSNFITRFDPLVRHTRRKSALPIAATSATQARWSAAEVQRSIVMPAIGIESRIARVEPRPSSGSLRLIYVGRLVHWKGVHLAVEAVLNALERGVDVHLTIVGDGPFLQRIEGLVSRSGMVEHFRLIGKLPREEVDFELLRQDAFIFPSLHDSGGMAVLEAMAVGLPVICLNAGGPAVLVDESCGVKIEVHRPVQVIQDLADAIVLLAANEVIRVRMGAEGRRRVNERYLWEERGKELGALYRQLSATQSSSNR